VGKGYSHEDLEGCFAIAVVAGRDNDFALGARTKDGVDVVVAVECEEGDNQAIGVEKEAEDSVVGEVEEVFVRRNAYPVRL
jgi:hypothetical protein